MLSPIDRLGNRFKAVIVDGFTAVFTAVITVLTWPFVTAMDAVSDYLDSKLQVGSYPGQHASVKLGFDQGMWADVQEDIQNTSGIARLITSVLFTTFGILGILTAMLGIGSRRALYMYNRILRNQIVGPDEAVAAWFRGYISEADMHDIGQAHGFDGLGMNIKQVNQTNIPDFAFLRELVNRGHMAESEAVRQLQYSGFKPEHAAEISKLFKVVPQVQDLISMAVREAFSPEIIAQYDLYADFPPEFATAAEQVGLTRDWALKYWAAHWRLPGVNQGYEMMHRGVIDESDMNLLLRTSDVMPFWRQKLIDISFRPLTRVDVRRMYKLGVLDRAAVTRAYLDVGYNPQNAELMTQFTELFGTEAERELTKGDVLNAYKRRLFTEAEAAGFLQTFGYGEAEAAFLLSRVDYDLAETKQKQVTRNIEIKFIRSIMTENETRAALLNAGLEQAEVGELMEMWNIKKGERLFTPSMDDMKRWFKSGFMTEEMFKAELVAEGVPDRYITYYIRDATPETETEKVRELSKADVLATFRLGLISESATTGRLAALGYKPEDIALLIDKARPVLTPEAERDLSKADVLKALRDGIITEPEARIRLAALKYGEDEINILIAFTGGE